MVPAAFIHRQTETQGRRDAAAQYLMHRHGFGHDGPAQPLARVVPSGSTRGEGGRGFRRASIRYRDAPYWILDWTVHAQQETT
jgi:hypothetical protein